MHFTPTTAWHQTGLRIHLERAADPADYSGSTEKPALAVNIADLNPSVHTCIVLTRRDLRRTALWLLWKSIVGIKV